MASYEVMIFDVDGTLIESGPYLREMLCEVLRKVGYGQFATDEFTGRFVGMPLHESFTQLCGMSEEESACCIDRFDEMYSIYAPQESQPKQGVRELLRELDEAGKTLAVATNGSTRNAVFILNHCGMSRYFDGIYGLITLGAAESKANVIRRALKDLQVEDKEKAVMIGDRYLDIDAAKECGIRSIGILFGYGSTEEIENSGADHIAKDADELRVLLLGD